MKTNNIQYWDLIAKHYANECTKEETKLLNQWLEQSEENKSLFEQIKKDQQIINMNQSMDKINVDSAWNKLKSRIVEDEQQINFVARDRGEKFKLYRVLKYAAMVILVAGLGFVSTKIYQDTFGYYSNTEFTAQNETSNEIILPDGTTVFLNADSELKYPDQFSGNQRKVKLEGEAFFDVTKNTEMPFIIETQKAEIRVLGTSFNVNTRLTDKEVEVYVESGLVELTIKKGNKKKLLVDPGNVGIISKNEISKEKNTDHNILAWKTKNIVFKEDKLGTVINTLNRIYHVDIQYTNDEILNYKLTSTFKNQDIESVIEVICVTFNLKVDYHEDEIILVKN